MFPATTIRRSLSLLTATTAATVAFAGVAFAHKAHADVLAPVSPAVTSTLSWFAPTSFWNQGLASDAALDPNSATYVATLSSLRTKYGSWINTTSYSEPVYRVPATQPLVKVTLDNAGTDATTTALRTMFAAGVPIPDNAKPAAGTDATLVIYQAATDTEWELGVASKKTDGWHAVWGGKLSNVSLSDGRFEAPYPRWGASGTSLPLMGGLMTIDEVSQGSIDHALAIALPEVRSTYYSWPAQRTDGQINSASAIPEGTRFRIDPSVNLDALPMSPLVRMMAKAVQKYGMVVRDRAGSVAFYGEDPTQYGTNPWPGFMGNQYPSTILAQFPWNKLQALKTQLAVDPY